MAICKKCGAHIEENLKYCDKCGSEISLQQEEVVDTQPVTEQADSAMDKPSLTVVEQVEGAVNSFLPHPFTKKGDRTSLMIGLGSMAALAVTYIVCFFAFMADICLPVGLSASGADGASALWIVAHFLFNLSPVFFVVKAFLSKKYRLYTIFVSAGLFTMTIFALIFWGMCEPGNFLESVLMYSDSAGSIAWFAFVDCLSEAWYLKIILSLSAVFGFGVDYIVNKGN